MDGVSLGPLGRSKAVHAEPRRFFVFRSSVPFAPAREGFPLYNRPVLDSAPRIPPRYLKTLLLRGTALWLLGRIMGKAALASVSATESAGLLSGWVVVMTAGLILIDLHRRRELALLHNLGVTTGRAVMLATLPAIVLEPVIVMLGL
jgi:hypothetical protein